MYQLVSRIHDGLGELKNLLESHIHNIGLNAIEKLGDTAINVRILRNSSTLMGFWYLYYLVPETDLHRSISLILDLVS